MTTVFIRKSGGNWNNNPAANPATNTGGIDISVMDGTTFYPTLQGSGDGNLTCNFGASAFNDPVPSGYTAGWPHSGGGFTTIDPTKLYGSALLSGGNLTCSFNTIAGMAQGVDGYVTGKYYFEVKVEGLDVFSTQFGGGIGANFSAGGDFNFWFANGQFNNLNANGGARFDGGFIGVGFAAQLSALGVALGPGGFTFVNGDIVDIAVFLESSVPPPVSTTLAELWFANTAGFVDPSSVSNRRKFYAVNGGAQNLGIDGSLPFGVAPQVFLTRIGAPSTFANNNARGGPFIESSGTLAASLTDPPGSSSAVTTTGVANQGQGVLGDYRNGNLYAFNPATYLDNGSQRKWVRRWRALPQATRAAVRYHYLVVAMETGAGVPQSENPQVVLRWSDDGGHTFGPERIIPVGKTGETVTKVKFNRLGATRRWSGSDRLFELSSTDQFKVAILDAMVEVS